MTTEKEMRLSLKSAQILNPEEAAEVFERNAQYWLGISGDEYVRRYEAGEFHEDESAQIHMAFLLPLVGRKP